MSPANREFPCEGCGAKLAFAIGTDQLECPYCGATVKIASGPAGPIREHALQEGLGRARKIDARQLSQDGKEYSCTTCGALTVISGQADKCCFCDSPVVLHQGADQVISPESVLPFRLDAKTAKDAYKKWLSSRWFAPSDLTARADRKGMDGVYLPYWTFDSRTRTAYHGKRGDHYYETERYTENGQTKTRQVQKTRWSPRSGNVAVDFDDVLVCASKGLPRNLTEPLEPWDLAELKTYEPSYLAGFLAERYSVGLEDGFQVAQERMKSVIEQAIERDIGGDVQVIQSMATQHQNTTFKHTLLPLWISSFRYGEKVYRFLVNARTGEVAGERPYSAFKITLAVLVGLLIVGAIVWFSQQK